MYKVETINDYMVASRMQSTGETMKIQMTYETKVRRRVRNGVLILDLQMLLDNIGGYSSELRGRVDVKGKGVMDTFWLLSRI